MRQFQRYDVETETTTTVHSCILHWNKTGQCKIPDQWTDPTTQSRKTLCWQ